MGQQGQGRRWQRQQRAKLPGACFQNSLGAAANLSIFSSDNTLKYIIVIPSCLIDYLQAHSFSEVKLKILVCCLTALFKDSEQCLPVKFSLARMGIGKQVFLLTRDEGISSC